MNESFLTLIGKQIDEYIVDTYIIRATNTILRLTNRTIDELTVELEDLIVDLAVYRYNLRNSTHLKSESYDGASFNYSTDIPDFLMTEIKAYRKMRVF